MNKDYSKVKYLVFSADDPFTMSFKDIVINLESNKIVNGILTLGEDCDPYKESYRLNPCQEYIDKLRPIANKNGILDLFAKVVDTGTYYLCDENIEELYVYPGYVPKLMDYYNTSPGFGDYIEISINLNNEFELAHKDYTNIFNYLEEEAEDWKPVNKQEKNLYTTTELKSEYQRGIQDFKDTSLRIISDYQKSSGIDLTELLQQINNWKVT